MKTIIIITIAILLTNNYLSAQTENGITYYDYTPDTIITCYRVSPESDSLKIDLDLNNTDDIVLFFDVSEPLTIWTRISSLNSAWEWCTIHSDTISSESHVWRNSGLWNYSAYSLDSLGIRYSDGDDFQYGWFKAEVTYDNTAVYIVVDKTAFCTIPNYNLIWGQTSTNGINIIDSTDTKLFLKNIDTGNLLVYYPNGIIGEVEIINSSGQLINNRNNINSDYTEINIANLQSGMYIVRAKLLDNTVVIAKFVK